MSDTRQYPDCQAVATRHDVGRTGWSYFAIPGPWSLCDEHESVIYDRFCKMVWMEMNNALLEDLRSDCPWEPPASWRPSWAVLKVMVDRRYAAQRVKHGDGERDSAR